MPAQTACVLHLPTPLRELLDHRINSRYPANDALMRSDAAVVFVAGSTALAV
jgi:hypothetical protein